MRKITIISALLLFGAMTGFAQDGAKEFGNSYFLKSTNPFDGEYHVVMAKLKQTDDEILNLQNKKK